MPYPSGMSGAGGTAAVSFEFSIRLGMRADGTRRCPVALLAAVLVARSRGPGGGAGDGTKGSRRHCNWGRFCMCKSGSASRPPMARACTAKDATVVQPRYERLVLAESHKESANM